MGQNPKELEERRNRVEAIGFELEMETVMTKIQAIMFDMGNVLLTFDARKSSKALADILKVSEEKLWEGFFISQMEKQYTRGEITTEEFFKRAKESFPDSHIEFEIFAHLWNDIFYENEGMEELLKKLKLKYKLYLISNTNELHFDHIKDKFDHLCGHFDKLYASHELGCRKPDRKIFDLVLREVGLKPEETIFVDDISENVEAANQFGIKGLLFTNQGALEKDLQALGVTF